MAAISGGRVVLLFLFALILFEAAPPSVWSQDKNEGSPVTIRMTAEMKFVPNRVTVKVGQTVEWVNEAEADGSTIHSVTTDPDKVMDPRHVSSPAGAEPFDSGIVKPGKSFRHTFSVPGAYNYACAPHEGSMRGEITVMP